MSISGIDHERVVCDSAFEDLMDHHLFARGFRIVSAFGMNSLPKEFIAGCEPYRADHFEV